MVAKIDLRGVDLFYEVCNRVYAVPTSSRMWELKEQNKNVLFTIISCLQK